MTGAVTLVVLFSLSYTLSVFLMSRRKRQGLLAASDDIYFVFLLPCLNEELVIGRTLDSLLAMPQENFAILVIDDGSDDGTADIVRGYNSERVWLLSRKAPEARRGKGHALNAAYRSLGESGILGGRAPEDVIVTILDADGRLAGNALREVAPYFRNPKIGAVQIGVRMYNRTEGMLARLQDMEFVAFTEIFQRGRQRVGSVGLGGNGQFTRLAALRSLGAAPWTDCLTEDLDLGIRLLCRGWVNDFCPTTHVAQQAVTNFRRLLRQRARWFQGHLQCWNRIPIVLASDKLRDRTVYDLLYHLTSPALVLLSTFPLMTFLLSLLVYTAQSPTGVFGSLVGDGGWLLVLWYALSFGLAPIYGFVYWLKDPETSLPKAIAIAHLYNLYSYLWFLAGWRGAWSMLRGRRSWAKTARTPDAPPAEAEPEAA
ncbi:MAG: glycosyltransferase family 2 protein [Actinomycetota bacterium]